MLTLAAAVLAAAAAAVAAANAAPSAWPATGEKVRVTKLAGRTSEKGVVVQTDAEFLTVSLGSGRSPVRIPLASIERLEVARGRRTAAKEGALLGGLTGAVLGGLAVAGLGAALCENASNCGASAEGYLVGMGILGAAGAGLGALTDSSRTAARESATDPAKKSLTSDASVALATARGPRLRLSPLLSPRGQPRPVRRAGRPRSRCTAPRRA